LLPNIELKTIDLKIQNLKDYEGKTLLVINVASQCGFTPQYKELQNLYEEFRNDEFEILAFPCNQFGSQEPGSGEQIAEFCQTTFGVQFQLFEKTNVNGEQAHPLFVFLKSKAPGILGLTSIKWNFTKFLIDKTGKEIMRFGPNDAISKIREHVIQLI
jgi:glutathione peroxidase